jgi:cation diffusion facilitator family transporter
MSADTKITEYRVVVTSFVVDVLDVVLNLTVAIATGSVVMFSEFFQGVADLTAAGFLIVGHRRAAKKPDKRYPFGYGKEIYFWTLISAVIMMTLTAAASFYMGLNRILHPVHITNPAWAVAALLIALCTNSYALSLSVRKLLRDRSPRELPRIFLNTDKVATKNAAVLDLMGSFAALFGLVSLLLYRTTGEARFDGAGAMIIGLTTAALAFVLILGVKGFLVGQRTSSKIEGKIRRAALSVREVHEVLDLRTMQVGTDKLLVNMEVHMQDRLTTDELEVLIDKIKKRVLTKVPTIQHIQVELETPEPSSA